jgi:hypothetical protein
VQLSFLDGWAKQLPAFGKVTENPEKFCLPKVPETIFIIFTCTPPQPEISSCEELLKKPGFGILKSQLTIFYAWEMINIQKGYTLHIRPYDYAGESILYLYKYLLRSPLP